MGGQDDAWARDFPLDLGALYGAAADDAGSAGPVMGLGHSNDGGQAALGQPGAYSPPQGIVRGTGGSPLHGCPGLLTRCGLAPYLVIQRAPHWNVAVLVPSELAIMLEVIGCEPYLRQYALAVCDACTSSWSVRYV